MVVCLFLFHVQYDTTYITERLYERFYELLASSDLISN